MCGSDSPFGERHNKERIKAHCEECQHSYFYPEGEDIPVATHDKDEEKKKCGCKRCGR